MINKIIPQTHNFNYTGCGLVRYNHINYTKSVFFTDTISSFQGCDSIYNLINIIVTVPDVTPVIKTVNLNDCNSITYKGQVYNYSTVLRDTIKSIHNCDSIYIITNINILGKNVFAYVPNSYDNTVSVVDLKNDSVTATVQVGLFPQSVCFNQDGSKVYVVNINSNSISVIKTADNTVINTITVGTRPAEAYLNKDGSKLYVINQGDNNLSVINTTNDTIITTISVGNIPYCMVASPDSNKLYVANYSDNTISVINTDSDQVTTTFSTIYNYPAELSISPDGNKLYVLYYGSGNFIGIISTTTYKIINYIFNVNSPIGMCLSPDGNTIYVIDNFDPTLNIINAGDTSTIAIIPVGNSPQGLSVSPDGSKVYVLNKGDNTVSVIDAIADSVISTISVGYAPYDVNNFIGSIYIPCSSGNTITGVTRTAIKKNIPNVLIQINDSTNTSIYPTDSYGQYHFSFNSNSIKIKPSKNNDINKTNGVTALDIALTQAHILGKNIFNSPYKLIAADVTGDGKVTALDIVYMKRLILGIDTAFTYGTAKDKRLWAFVDSSYKFADSTNPFPIKDSISFTGLSVSKTNQTFIGCKLGDVNWDWSPSVAKPMINNVNALELSYNPIKANNEQFIRVPVIVKNFRDMLGIQYTINFNPSVLKWVGVDNNTLNFETGTSHSDEGKVSFLWVDDKNEIKTLADGSVIFNLVFEKTGDCINEQLDLDGSVTSVVAYDKDYQSHNVVFKPSVINSLDTKDVWTVSPNPTKDGVINVQMNLREKKSILFRLVDNTGRVLMVKQVEGVKGSNNITLREGNIAGGTYYLQAVGIEGVKEIQIR